jgi:hypothetical protein
MEHIPSLLLLEVLQAVLALLASGLSIEPNRALRTQLLALCDKLVKGASLVHPHGQPCIMQFNRALLCLLIASRFNATSHIWLAPTLGAHKASKPSPMSNAFPFTG